MKLVIQIPCYNEQGTLAVTLGCLPREVPGFDMVEWLVIDDGSEDDTARVAAEEGVDHIIRFTRNQGLAAAFLAGLDASLAAGADVIVNTDADNQYDASCIPALTAPILAGTADLVIGARPIQAIDHFSGVKKLLQNWGSWVVRAASNTQVPDAPSGFRAFSRKAAMELNVFNEYTYTLETIIQAGQKRLAVTAVPVSVNADLRRSRLVRSIPSYVWRSCLVICRIFITYKPFAVFTAIGGSVFLVGLLIAGRFLYHYLDGNGAGHVQSVILAALLLGVGFFLGVGGVIADLISVNRKLLERIDYRLRRLELGEHPLSRKAGAPSSRSSGERRFENIESSGDGAASRDVPRRLKLR
ncbi:MAG TPA: glycosyltransferase family 2 protein [Polyangiaceae bacterium]|nr:glycosyltransferase family 2 protein [Polyangiaceae bacterium]